MKQYEEMEQYCMECGAFKAKKVIDTDRIPFDENFAKRVRQISAGTMAGMPVLRMWDAWRIDCRGKILSEGTGFSDGYRD